MDINQIREKLRKKAILFETGRGFAQNPSRQSWIGTVNVGYANEELPLDRNNKPMIPIMQLYLEGLPFIPEPIKNAKLLTVFISNDFLDDIENGFCIREYANLDKLVLKNYGGSDRFLDLMPYPLTPKLIENDFPTWDSNCIPEELEKVILKKIDAGEIEGYYDGIVGEDDFIYSHKVGGYASYCQETKGFPEGYEFVLQLASDNDIDFNIIDGGKIYFAKNSSNNSWKADWDCY